MKQKLPTLLFTRISKISNFKKISFILAVIVFFDSGNIMGFEKTSSNNTTEILNSTPNIHNSISDSKEVETKNNRVSVSSPLALSLTQTGSPINCYNDYTNINLSISGGASPYSVISTITYIASNGNEYGPYNSYIQEGNNSVNHAGRYNITVTDANGNSTSGSITISGPMSELMADAFTMGGTGVMVMGQGGTYPYSGTGSFNATPGTHTYTITDANGCTATSNSITVYGPLALSITQTGTPINCYNDYTNINLSISGGASPYSVISTITYIASNGNEYGPYNSYIQEGNNSVNRAGRYNITVTDANGNSTSGSITISGPMNELRADAFTTQPISCQGGTTSIMIMGQGGTYPYSGASNFTVSAGSYTYTITDAKGCTASTSINVSEPTPGTITSAQSICYGTAPNSITVSGFTGTISKWQSASDVGFTSPTDINTTSSTLSPSTLFSDTWFRAVITNQSCPPMYSSIKITVKAPASITSATADLSSICTGTNTTIIANGVAGSNTLVTWWSATGGTGTNLGTGTTLTGGPGTYYARVTGDCSSVAETSITIGTVTDKTWLGTTNNSWNTDSNWSCGSAPLSTDIIVISSGNPQLDINFTVAGSLTLSGTGTLTINPTKVLTASGAVDFGGKSVTLKSDVTGSGTIGRVTGTLIGASNVTVERYIPAKRAWRALTAPVSTASSIFTNWQEGGNGSGTNGFDIWSTTGTNGLSQGAGNSLLEYNSADNTWTGIINTQASSSMLSSSKNKSFMAFVTGPYGSGNITTGATETTLRATGTLFSGTQSYASASGEYTFIGNPYASPLNLYSMLTDSENVTNFGTNIWVWDAKAAGTNTVGAYNTFDSANSLYTNNTTSTSGDSNITTGTLIQSGQAFFVKQSSGSSVDFKIKEEHKGTTFSNAVFRQASVTETLRVGLYKQVNNEWIGKDGAMTVLFAQANVNQLPNKMANGTENVAFTKNAELFASNHHLPLVASDVLNVRVWNTTAGTNYKLKINTEQFNTTNLNATLEDLFTNSRTSIALDGTAVEYPFAVTTEAASTGNRFRIVFETNALGINNPKASGISILPNPITGDAFQVNLGTLSTGTYSYSICNTLGQEVEKGSINNVSQKTSYTVKFKNNTAAGMYIMKVTGTDNSVFTAKIIKQ